ASFQAILDPYARADFFVSFGEEGVELEEGFITFPAIPGGLLVRVGKMRAAFGKVNSLHNHVLPWADRPIVINNLVGGEDGIDDAGISVARLIPNPGFFLRATRTRSIPRSCVGGSELMWSRREQPVSQQNAFGYYVSGDYQFARRWFAGARYDRSAHAADETLHDSGGSFLLTFVPSEFSQVRGQYRRIDYAIGDPANEF